MELMGHKEAVFVTLTYDGRHFPAPYVWGTEGDPPQGGVLVKEHLARFFKRLRVLVPERKIRYYACGEYGDKTWRPHYHMILYGVSPVESELLEKAWGMGFVHVGTVEPDSIQYVTGYIAKKLTSSKGSTDPRKPEQEKLRGRPPEFCVMSRRPGIGQVGVEKFIQALRSNPGVAASLKDGSIPETFMMGMKKYPMDRFTKQKLYSALGIEKEVIQRRTREVLAGDLVVQMKMGSKAYSDRRKSRVAAQSGKINLQRKRML